MSIIVNKSLAKGLAKRFVRERTNNTSTRFKNALDNYRPAAHRRGPVYRSVVNVFKSTYKNEIIDECIDDKGMKTEGRIMFYWDTEKNNLCIEALCITKRKPWDYEIFEILCVSKHATERIYERLNSTELDIVSRELISCLPAVMALMHNGIDFEDVTGPIMVPTQNGLAVFVNDDEKLWTVTTWLSESMLDEKQREYFNQHLHDKTFNITMHKKNSNISLNRTFSIEPGSMRQSMIEG